MRSAAIPPLDERTARMVPAGFMAKYVEARPEWLKAGRVVDIHSVSNCISKDFGDWVDSWKHNGYRSFDTPEAIRQVARERHCSLDGTSLFYYEVHEFEFDADHGMWNPVVPELSFTTQVVPPIDGTLEGYDVVTFEDGFAAAGCSPLSCNGLAADLETNRHCLLDDFESARRSLEEGKFDHSEPGPFRIIAVYSTGWP